MNWNLTRGIVYLACFIAAGMSLAGFADFDAASGNLAIHPFNVYAVAGSIGGAVSSVLATLALFKGWGGKK